jgi:transcriptional regulator
VPSQPDLDVIRGTLDLLILKSLSWGPMHGLAVLRWIEQGSQRRLQIEEGALYPALHRMEQKGWLESDWGYTDQGRRARFYRLTPSGRRRLAEETATWRRFSGAVDAALATS